jgi:hypothetical protein
MNNVVSQQVQQQEQQYFSDVGFIMRRKALHLKSHTF